MDLDLWRKTKKERGITYQDISDRSGIPLGTIKNIFAGYTPDPRESTIKAIEQVLGVETRIVHYSPDFTAEEIQLINDYRALSPALQKMLRATLETWKSSDANAGAKKKNTVAFYPVKSN